MELARRARRFIASVQSNGPIAIRLFQGNRYLIAPRWAKALLAGMSDESSAAPPLSPLRRTNSRNSGLKIDRVPRLIERSIKSEATVATSIEENAGRDSVGAPIRKRVWSTIAA